MVKNHIFLVMRYVDRLMHLAMQQNWVDKARTHVGDNQEAQQLLDHMQTQIIEESNQIHEEMFEISRSN